MKENLKGERDKYVTIKMKENSKYVYDNDVTIQVHEIDTWKSNGRKFWKCTRYLLNNPMKGKPNDVLDTDVTILMVENLKKCYYWTFITRIQKI